MRANLETRQNPVASFGDWNKYETASDQPGFYGDYHHVCQYIHTLNHRKISIHFKFGRPSIQFITESLTVGQLKEISNQFTRPKTIKAGSKISDSFLSQPYLLDYMEVDHILSQVTFSTEEVDNPVQLEYTLKALADYTQLPKDMHHDIHAALNKHVTLQKKHMEELSNKLLHGTPDIVKELQENIGFYNIHEKFGVVLRWIDYLVKHNRVNEALLWCDIIPLDSGQSYLDHQKLALQLLKDNPDMQAIVLYQNGTQVELSCQEAIFYFSYNIAKFTKNDCDETAVKKSLTDLSVPTESFSNILSESHLLIQQARIIRTLQNEVAQLKKNVRAQQNNSGSILGNLGIFGQSNNSEINAVNENEEDGISMDVFAAAFAFIHS